MVRNNLRVLVAAVVFPSIYGERYSHELGRGIDDFEGVVSSSIEVALMIADELMNKVGV
ncbi:hypothetical protein LCGC14_0949800 [marine sediment metagenome]|uniref:Uncharacterized protein n=1 Tax=marine sediment metagenome TaxID=412755 RepID=A0A0F9R139_9ZZZZ